MISPEELRRYPFFTRLSYQELITLSSFSSLRRFTAGERLFQEGEDARNLRIVKSGQVDIIYQVGDNREVVAESAISGDLVAWSALLPPCKLTASGIGVRDGELIEIDGPQLRKLCDSDPDFGYHMLLEVAKGLRDRLCQLRVQIAAAEKLGSIDPSR